MNSRIPALLVLAVFAAVGVIGIGHAAATTDQPAASSSAVPAPSSPQWNDHTGLGRFARHGTDQQRMTIDPVRLATRQLRLLERLYRANGRGAEIPALYQDVLAHTQNPTLRNFAYARLAHAEMRPEHPEQAIEILRKGLDESLKRVH